MIRQATMFAGFGCTVAIAGPPSAAASTATSKAGTPIRMTGAHSHPGTLLIVP